MTDPITREPEDEVTAQMLRLADECMAATDQRDALVAAARAVLEEVGTGSPALVALDTAVRNAYAESDGDPDTVVPVEVANG